jgi:hypothetical protein
MSEDGITVPTNPRARNHCPVTGHFLPGNQVAVQSHFRADAARLRKVIAGVASDDLVREKLIECLNNDSTKLAALTLILHYVVGKPMESIAMNLNTSTDANALAKLSPETIALIAKDLTKDEQEPLEVEAKVIEAD